MAGAARPPTQGRSRPGFGGERGETRVDKNQHSFERMFKRQCARACPGVLGYTGTYQCVCLRTICARPISKGSF